MFELARSEAKGVWASAQIEVRARWIERLVEEQSWASALHATLALAAQLSPLKLSPGAWREVVLEGARCALYTEERGLLSELCEDYLWMAWSGQGAEQEPWELIALCGQLGDQVTLQMGAHLGDALTRAYARSPVGPYLSGHYRERRALERHGAGSELGANLWRFQRAFTLAEAQQRERFVEHCRLRYGVCGLLAGEAPASLRAMMKSINISSLRPQERLWYALGMSQAPFWLDRVRGIDELDELASHVTQARPGELARELDVALLERSLEWMLARERGASSRSAEADRLRGVIDEVYNPGSPRAVALGEVLSLRQALAERGDVTLKEGGELLEMFARRASALGGGWPQSVKALQALRHALLGEAPLQGAAEHELDDRAPWLTISRLGLKLLEAILSQDDEAAAEALVLIRRHVITSSELPESYRPFFALLPRVLQWLKQMLPSSRERKRTRRAGDPEAIASLEEREARRERFGELLDLALSAMVSRHAPTPSYGWWALSAALVESALFESAQRAVERALELNEKADPALKAHALGHLLNWACTVQDDPVTMRLWLERCEAL